MSDKPDCLKEANELEKVGDVHYEIVGYGVDMAEIISAPENMEQAIDMAVNDCGWGLESIDVIRKVRVEEVFFPGQEVK